MKIKIISDGTVKGTRAIDTITNKTIPRISGVELRITPYEPVIKAKLNIDGPELLIEELLDTKLEFNVEMLRSKLREIFVDKEKQSLYIAIASHIESVAKEIE